MAKIQLPDKAETESILRQADKFPGIIQLAKANGLRLDELEMAIRYHQLDYPLFYSQRELTIKEEFPRLQKQGLTLKQIAAQFGMDAVTLRRVIFKLGLEVLNVFDEALDEALQVRHYLMTRGGTIKNAVSELGFPFKRLTTICRALREMKFDSTLYRHVGKRQGNWLVLAAEPGQSRYHHRCLCTRCNTIHLVQKDNFASGASTQCSECAKLERKSTQRLAVEDVGTGEVFTSVKAAHASVADQISEQVFYRRMRKDQMVTLASGKRFRFVLPPGEEVSQQRYLDYFYGGVGTDLTPDQLMPDNNELAEVIIHCEPEVAK